MATTFNTWFNAHLKPVLPALCLLRFAVIKGRLERLGYTVSGEVHNTADYGLPQQRRRASVLAVLMPELDCRPDGLSKCVRSFQRWNCPLNRCVDLNLKHLPRKDSNRGGEKWREAFKELGDTYGKARRYVKLEVLCSVINWNDLVK